MNVESLTEAERDLFEDAAIERSYQEWRREQKFYAQPTRKAFLMRIRALYYAGVQLRH